MTTFSVVCEIKKCAWLFSEVGLYSALHNIALRVEYSPTSEKSPVHFFISHTTENLVIFCCDTLFGAEKTRI